jgi:hypothetical protein
MAVSNQSLHSAGEKTPQGDDFSMSHGTNLSGSQPRTGLQYQPPGVPQRSRVGFASFVAGLISMMLLFILTGLSGYWSQQAAVQDDSTIETALFLAATLVAVIATSVAALILGLMGGFRRRRNRFYATWGVRLSAIVLGVLFLFVMVVALLAIL